MVHMSRLSVMNFLNEAESDYPTAISFASGRPADAYFDIESWLGASLHFYRHAATAEKSDLQTVRRKLSQYGRTRGIINDLVAAQVFRDEGIVCKPDRVVITVGCQEAIALCLQVFCDHPNDIVLARNPTYIGMTGVADLAGVEIVPFERQVSENWAEALDRSLTHALAQGKCPKMLYLIPEFDNPTGTVISESDREALLAVCAEYRVIVLEDNAYAMFRFEGEPRRPMAALDRHGSVIYLGTYSKTLCPAVRVGYAVIPEALFGDTTASNSLLAELGERKSFLTVNTSQLNQALVAGVLIAQGGSLRHLVQPALDAYRKNRDSVIDSLGIAFAEKLEGVSWNHPQGGFFLSIDLPFTFGREELVTCASMYHVIPMPMSFFALDGSHTNRVRIGYSNVRPEDIAEGVRRFANYVHDRLVNQKVA